MNVVDSSGWLEYFADRLNADFFAPAIENIPELVVPSLIPRAGCNEPFSEVVLWGMSHSSSELGKGVQDGVVSGSVVGRRAAVGIGSSGLSHRPVGAAADVGIVVARLRGDSAADSRDFAGVSGDGAASCRCVSDGRFVTSGQPW